jgi:tight adherence protein B
MAIPVILFVVVAAIVLAVYWVLVVRPESEEQRRLRKRMKVRPTATTARATSELLKQERPLSNIKVLNSVLGSSTRLSGSLGTVLEQSGLRITLGSLILLSGCAALGGYLLIYLLFHARLVALCAGLAFAFIPYMYVRYARTRRLIKFEEQFPEAIDLLSRALRAGHAFTTGLNMVADEMPAPVGAEFRLVYDRQNFGMPMVEAMRSFAQRVPIIDARFFVTAVLTQREAGGNLSEVLDNLASVIRERFKVKRQVRVISAHGRISGWVLAALPPALAAAMFVINPDHILMLVRDPLGIQMIVVGLFLQVIGTVIIRKMVNIEY